MLPTTCREKERRKKKEEEEEERKPESMAFRGLRLLFHKLQTKVGGPRKSKKCFPAWNLAQNLMATSIELKKFDLSDFWGYPFFRDIFSLSQLQRQIQSFTPFTYKSLLENRKNSRRSKKKFSGNNSKCILAQNLAQNSMATSVLLVKFTKSAN